ncbi:MAG: hypothetical protein M3P11_01240 [Actinomycetota bacterium]|nr:hypothetical protein [Actinomycetota bacterium]
MIAAAPPAETGQVHERAAEPRAAKKIASALAGPVVIVGSVLFALRGYAFHPLLTNTHPDILGFWLPRYAFLGRSLAAGHVPLWNPFEMAGHPFAADPQSGWLYAPAMVLFSWLPPGAAIRALIVLNPVFCGLGMYAFLRSERLGRIAATGGGLSAAMLISTSWIAISLPFAGVLAWTPVVLLSASRYRHTERWSRRLAWLAVGAFGWSQVANAHMSHGLTICTLLVGAFLVVQTIVDVRGEVAPLWPSVGRSALFLVALPLGSLPVLIPRLAFIKASSLHAGYFGVADSGKGSSAGQEPPLWPAMWAGWPLALGAAPGSYAGAVILLALPFASRARRWRALLWAFGGVFVVGYVAMLDILLNAGWFRRLLLNVPFGDVYLHNPGRFRYLAVIAIPVLGAIGIQGLIDEPIEVRRIGRWLAGSVVLWLGVPLALGADPARFALLAVSCAIAIPLFLLLAVRRRTWAAGGLVAVLTAELLAGAAWSQRTHVGDDSTLLDILGRNDLLAQALPWPNVSERAFLADAPFVSVMQGRNERYLTWAPPGAAYDKGYLLAQTPKDWPSLVMERGTLFNVEDMLGYNPVQLPRYWAYIRATNPLPVYYNASVVNVPSLEDVRLFGVRFLIVPAGVPPPIPVDGTIASDRDFDLLQVSGWEPRVSVVPRWTVTATPPDALHAVLTQGYDPATEVILEQDPGLGAASPDALAGTATYAEPTPENVSVSVDATAPSIVVIRNAYFRGWTATVDGVPTPVLATDFLMQGVAVGQGHHEIKLTYKERAVTLGIEAGAVPWFLLIGGIGVVAVVERRRRSTTG